MIDPRMRLAELLTAFFTRHLAAELNASPHTILSYRDTFRFLLRHLSESTRRQVSQLTYDDFTPEAILSFLENLERLRRNSTATRNARLAAIRSFFSYVVNRDPAAAVSGIECCLSRLRKRPGALSVTSTSTNCEPSLAVQTDQLRLVVVTTSC